MKMLTKNSGTDSNIGPLLVEKPQGWNGIGPHRTPQCVCAFGCTCTCMCTRACVYVCLNGIVCAVQMKVRVWSVYVCICVYSRQPLMGIMCGVSSTDVQKHANPHPPCTVRINTRAHTQTRRHTKMHTERASVSELRTTPKGGKAPVFVCVHLWVCVRVAEHTLCFRRMGDGGGVEG